MTAFELAFEALSSAKMVWTLQPGHRPFFSHERKVLNGGVFGSKNFERRNGMSSCWRSCICMYISLLSLLLQTAKRFEA